MEKIIIFDTTLRDGEQSPGASLGAKGKVEIARQLERLGVDVIEAGFPITSTGDFESVCAISQVVRKPIVCALARAKEEDIKAAFYSLKKARKKRVHVFLATSKIHMKYKLRKPEDEILKLMADKIPLLDAISDLRTEMVESCVHPMDFLLIDHKENHILCKFCEKQLSIPNVD